MSGHTQHTLDEVLARWRERLRPDAAERDALAAAVASLEAAARGEAERLDAEGVTFTPLLVGSAAKDTWLHGHVDIDLFLMFDPSVPRDRLEALGLEIGQAILPEWRLRYAEHPYVHGTWHGYDADIVPAYAVADAHAIQSAVDRTPFHNRWVMDALAARPELTDEIRLCKAWLRGVGVYGAETTLGGVSGYLAEVLVIHHGGFVPFLRAAEDAEAGWRLDPTGASEARFPNSIMVVIDPVDRERNAASAVVEPQFHRLVHAARAFLASPGDRFFDPAPLPPLELARMHALLGGDGFAFVTLPLPVMREDARVPHLRRGAQALGRQLERDGFQIVSTDAGEDVDDEDGDDGGDGGDGDGRAWLSVRTRPALLSAERDHVGPPPDVASRADSFRAKYADHPDVVSPVEVRDVRGTPRLVVRLRNRRRSLTACIEAVLSRRVSLGKHLDAALRTGPVEALSAEEAHADPQLRSVLAEALCPVEPWERTGEPEHDYALVPAAP